ncbi:MAG: HlyD family type I secretion periplasmic adaptor subunit [Alphaproteobacteria bacterium]
MAVKDTDFMCELEAATRMRPSKPVVIMLFAIAAFITFFLIWAAVTEVQEVTRGQGQVIPSQEVQIIQSLEGGILQELLIQKGDIVRKGQVLLRIRDVHFASEQRGSKAQFLSLEVKKARLSAEANATEFTLSDDVISKAGEIAMNERALYESRQKELQSAYAIYDERIKKASANLKEVKAEIRGLSENKRLLNKELSMTREMVAKRAVPKLEQIRLERQAAEITGQINARKEETKGLDAELAGAKKEHENQGDNFRSVALEELNEVETQMAALKESLKSIGDRVERTEIRAPVDGIVNQIMIQTIGGVIEPAMKLVEIVPTNDELKIIAQVRPNEIAFIKINQPVKVKITAYDAQKYGALEGHVKRIAANSTKDREGNTLFELEVRTEKNFLGAADAPLPITTGMVADIDVITGKRTILNYLIKPFHRGLERALKER